MNPEISCNDGIITVNDVNSFQYDNISKYTSATKLVIKGKIALIEHNLFYGNTKPKFAIETIDMELATASLTYGCFRGLSNLKNVTIGPFVNCTTILNPFAEANESLVFTIINNPYFYVIDECLYFKDQIVCIPRRIVNVSIPSNISIIHGIVGYHSNYLESVTLNSVIVNGEHAPFMRSPNLRRISGADENGTVLYMGTKLGWVSRDYIGNFIVKRGTTTIMHGAFDNCENITSVYIPSSVHVFGTYLFANTSALKKITICGNVTFYPDFGKSSSYEIIEIRTETVNFEYCLTSNVKTIIIGPRLNITKYQELLILKDMASVTLIQLNSSLPFTASDSFNVYWPLFFVFLLFDQLISFQPF